MRILQMGWLLAGLAVVVLGACSSSGSGGTVGSGGTGGSGASGAGGSGGGAAMTNCPVACVGVMASQCTYGPATQEECVSGCEDFKSGPCSAEFSTLAACGGANPQYACDANGSNTVTGCESQYGALITCLSAT